MSAEERELMEEMEAIKEAQKAAKELFGVPKEKVNKVQEKAAPPSNEAGGPLERKKAPEGLMARWLARTGVQGVES